jgi:hypothetical protein
MYDRPMKAILCALLFMGCGSLTVQPDPTNETPQMYFDRNVEPLVAAKCSACHGELDYATLTQELDDNYTLVSNVLLLDRPDQTHQMTWTTDERAAIEKWLQMESAARGN